MHLDPRNASLRLRPWRKVRGHAGMARLNAECLDVGTIEVYLRESHQYPKTVGVKYHKPTGRLVVLGDILAFTSDRHAYVLGTSDQIHWRQAKAVAPIAQRFGAKVSMTNRYYADWEAGDMQGTLKAPRARVHIQNE